MYFTKGVVTMRKLFVPSALVLVAIVLAAVLLAVNSGLRISYANKSIVVHVGEHAITDTEVNVGQSKSDALGNQLVFHNPVYDVADKGQVGHDNGNCVRTVVGQVWECYWTTFLAGGQITVEGPYYDSGADSWLAITGGTGNYREAHGQMRLHARGNPVGSEYDFVFYLN
jgi:allene oxide cyclase